MKKEFLISLLFLVVPAAKAGMTIDDCLRYAREHAHRNKIGRLEIKRADIEVRLYSSSMMPYLQLYGNGNMSFGRNIDPETNTYDTKQTLSTGFGVQISMPLFDGLVNLNNFKSARAARLKMRQTAQAEEDAVSMDVIKAFYQVFYYKAIVEQMEQQFERDTRELTAAEKGVQLGTKSGADVAELKALVSGDEFQLVNSQNLLSKAYMDLRAAMGMELSDSPLDLDEEYEPSGSGIITKHPKIAEGELDVEIGKYDLRAAKGLYFPVISLTGGVSSSYYKMMGTDAVYPSFEKQFKDNMGEFIGVSLSIPLFDGLSTASKVRRASILLKEKEVRLEQIKYEMEKEISVAELDYISSQKELDAACRRVDAETVAYEATKRKYELGQASALDLYTSSSKLSAAKAELVGKKIQKIINLFTLRYSRGEKLIKD